MEGMGDCWDRDGFWLAKFFWLDFLKKRDGIFKNPVGISVAKFFWQEKPVTNFPAKSFWQEKHVTNFPAIFLDIIVIVGPQSFGDMIFKKQIARCHV